MKRMGENVASAANLLKSITRYSLWYRQIKFARYLPDEAGTQVAGDAGSQSGTEPANDAGSQPGASTPQSGSAVATPAAGGNQDEIAGLKAAAAAEREKRQTAETEAQILRDQMALQAANQPQTQPQAQESLYEQVAKHLGYDLEYPLSVQEHGRVTDTMMQIQASRQAQTAFLASHSDYGNVVGTTVNGNFHPAPPLKAYWDKHPGSREEFMQLGNNPAMQRLAYRIVTTDPDYKAAQKEAGLTEEQKKAAEAQAKIDAANKPASISSVPGGGNLDKAAHVRGLSDEQFRTHIEGIMDG
jgi:hypothetical protein